MSTVFIPVLIETHYTKEELSESIIFAFEINEETVPDMENVSAEIYQQIANKLYENRWDAIDMHEWQCDEMWAEFYKWIISLFQSK